jgi:hypothetical protein
MVMMVSPWKLPDNIPKSPKQVYGKSKEWGGWPDFLGYKRSGENVLRERAIEPLRGLENMRAR